MKQLAPGPACEAWVAPEPAKWFENGRMRYGLSGGVMFGVVQPREADFASIGDLAFTVYRELFSLAERAGCPHVLRVYNYLPHITQSENGEERYRSFNLGRHKAFEACGRAVSAAPAACALGTQDGDPAIYFVASTQPGRPLENPRQVSAYHYPAQYGPRSPSFSRAMLYARSMLLVSGTASIVGHETLHLGNPAAQTEETLRNIQALLATCGRSWSEAADGMSLKVYIRHEADVAIVSRHMAHLPLPASQLILQADICRPDLLIEVEAFCALTNKEAVLF